MSVKPVHSGTQSFYSVLGFMWRHWRRHPGVVAGIVATMIAATVADMLMPLYAGRLVDAVAVLESDRDAARHAALAALVAMLALGAAMIAMRWLAITGIMRLTPQVMSAIAQEAFFKIQRMSTEWHANTFSGSVVRRITRGMWAVDLLTDTVLIALLPSALVLLGTTVLLGVRWPWMGIVVVCGSAAYIALSVSLSLMWVAPAARLSNKHDTRIGATLADAVTCNAVVKMFGAETREDGALHRVLARWSQRVRRAWTRGIATGTGQLSVLLVLRGVVIVVVLLLCFDGKASAGDVAFVLTTYVVIQGYLRDVGVHVANLQRSVNEMEEMVVMHNEPLGVEDRDNAPPIRISAGEVRCERVTFRYHARPQPVFEDLSVTIRAGERVGLVGHSGSGSRRS